MSRNTRYFGGIGKGRGGSRFVVYDSDGKVALEMDTTPDVASKTLIDGEVVWTPPNGQEMELDNNGPVQVLNAQEKRAYYKKTGCRPAPVMRFSQANPHNRGTKRLKKTFAQHFYEENGYSLKEHMRTRYGEGADLTMEA